MSENVNNTNLIFLLEEVYALEDFGNFTMIKNSIQKNNTKIENLNSNNFKDYVRITFLIGETSKEILMKIDDLKRVYSFIKIIYNNFHLNLLLYQNDVYEPNEILKRMNSDKKIFKGAIGINLKIKEFPLINYVLTEIPIEQGDKFTDKLFLLKKMNSEFINKNFNNTQLVLNLKMTTEENHSKSPMINDKNYVHENKNNSNNSSFNNIKKNTNNSNFTNNINNNNNANNSLNSNVKNINNNCINANNNSHSNQFGNNQQINVNGEFNNNIDNLSKNSINKSNNCIKQNNMPMNNNMPTNNNMQMNNNIQMNNNNMQMNNNIPMNYNNMQMNNNIQMNYNNMQMNNNMPMNYNNMQMNYNNMQMNNNMPMNYNNIQMNNNNMQVNNNMVMCNNNMQVNNNNMLMNNNIQMNNSMPMNNNMPMNYCQNNNLNTMPQIFPKNFQMLNNNMGINSNSYNNFNNKNNKNNNKQEELKPKTEVKNQNKNNGYANINKNVSIFDMENKDVEKFFPLIGLKNVGLTCYMNSTLQCLLHIPELNYFFINIYPDQKKMFNNINEDVETRGRLSEGYYEVVKGTCKELITGKKMTKNFWSYEDDSFSPKKFNNLLSQLNPDFSKFEPNDSKDLLLYLFQSMHEELNYNGKEKLKKVPQCNQLIEKESYNFFSEVNSNLNLSIFSYLFYGIIKSNTYCTECRSTLYNFQYFQFLSFPAYNYRNKEFNIYRGFKDYVKPEKMIGDNQCYCQECKGLKDAIVSSKIFYAPPYLIINFDYGKNKKYVPNKVVFGGIIDLTDFTDEQCEEKTYELIAVSTHMGSSGTGGHYIAYCKDKNNNKWYKFNDSFVKECQFGKVNSYSPYFLIFKRIPKENI